ncbi:tRNA adenosine(34) deaminase TadA [Miniphocaeibacter massiliensis]|uniref:tRNA adenosine(34) deaminase TadA n=1 Tax=Miniphocaeibacter massiliensis TaxID=2041841 RepID=UPI001A924516|nr:tRNA adenosine(34) deaminase TadA [Miniphocaeibacter massiliensis]
MEDVIYMREALKEAKIAKDKNEIPIGCVIVKDNKIIARGHNLVETTKNPLKHAELIAIEEACKNMVSWRLHGCTMYVTLEPCAMCAGALVYSRIDRVVFGAYDNKRGFCGSVDNLGSRRELNHKFEVTSGVIEEECLIIIQEFFKELRETKKK